MIKIAVSTLGCPKNLVDSENMISELLNDGFSVTDDANEADVLVLNTCGFIDNAKEESVTLILEYAEIKKHKSLILVVVGCLVERYRDNLKTQIPDVDIWLGVGDITDLSDEIKKFFPKKDLIKDVSYRKPWEIKLTPSHYMYLKVADGCNNRCSFCVIPYIRGNYISRPIKDIVEDARASSSKGVREVLLVAQDVSGYGVDLKPSLSLVDVIEELDKIDDLLWIRLMYMYPDKITDRLIDVIANSKKVCRYIDVPFQHISAKILKSMRRKETRESIYELVGKLRSKIEGLFIRTSLIVGYPGETESDFAELLSAVEELKFERLGVFLYSDEEGTPAFELTDKVPKKIAKERYHRIMSLQKKNAKIVHQSLIEKDISVMIDSFEDRNTIIGRTEWDAPEIDGVVKVLCDGSDGYSVGDVVQVRIKKSYEYDLEGVLV